MTYLVAQNFPKDVVRRLPPLAHYAVSTPIVEAAQPSAPSSLNQKVEAPL